MHKTSGVAPPLFGMYVVSNFSRSSVRSRCILVKLHSNVSSGRCTALQKGIPPGVQILNGFCRSGKTVNTQSNYEAPRKLRILASFGNPEQLDSSETVEQTEQLENAQHKKEMLETLKTQHNYKKQRTPKTQRNYIIRKTTLPPAAGRDVPQKPLHLGVLHP